MNQWRIKEGWCTARGADFTEKSIEFGKSPPINFKVARACAAPVMDISSITAEDFVPEVQVQG